MPDGPCWPPEDVVGESLINLLAGREDLTQWSADVRRALEAVRVDSEQWRRRRDDVPASHTQLEVGAQLAIRRVARFLRDHPHASRDELRPVADAAWMAGERAMRRVARLQQRRRGRSANLRSVIDGWRWRGGRPPAFSAPALLLKVEVWRDVRARLRPLEGRVTRAEALAEIVYAELQTDDPATACRITHQWQALEEAEQRGYAVALDVPASAYTLMRAVRAVCGKPFRSLETRLSQALSPRPASTDPPVP